MRTWLIIIGGLVALGILLDSIRRMRKARRDSLPLDVATEKDALVPGLTPEKPARTINGEVKSPAASRFSTTGKVEPTLTTTPSLENTLKTRIPPVNLEQAVPLLMDEEGHGDADFHDATDLIMGGVLGKPRVVARPPAAGQGEEVIEQEVIVINVMSRQPEGFVGAELLENLLASGMRYGSMNIFHHYVSGQDETALFSMANMVKPGTFDLDNMKSFQTPGVSFFMAMPLKDGQASATEVFDKMLSVARRIAQNLQGELRDQQRSVMTGQTIEHCRQRISEFSRKKLSRSGKYTADH